MQAEFARQGLTHIATILKREKLSRKKSRAGAWLPARLFGADYVVWASGNPHRVLLLIWRLTFMSQQIVNNQAHQLRYSFCL